MENDMLKEVLSYPQMLDAMIEPLTQSVQEAIDDATLDQIERIYLYGSGDSLNVATCAVQAFWEYTHVPTYAVPALTASRYLAKDLLPSQAAHSLVICISSSGEAARSAEAAANLRSAGFVTMAITANPDSRVGKSTQFILRTKAPDFPKAALPIPGIRSFMPPMLSLYLLAVRLGLRRKALTQSQADAIRAELCGLSTVLRTAMQENDSTLCDFAKLCAKCERMEFLAGGSCRGATDFGVSKVLEGQGYMAQSQDLEEFAHQTFFCNDTHTLPTVLLMPSQGRSLSRAEEILFVLQKLERPILVMTDNLQLAQKADTQTVMLCNAVSEPLISLVFACLMAYLAAVMPLREGDIFLHGHRGVYCEDELPTVRGSRLETGASTKGV